MVDAIQGVGALRLDVAAHGLDACALACHKWLLGPRGGRACSTSPTGSSTACARPATAGARWPAEFAGTEIDPTPAEGALRFEAGTLNLYGIHGLGATLDLLRELGTEAVEARVLALADRAAAGLERLGFELALAGGRRDRVAAERSGIVAGAHPERTAEALSDALAERGIVTSYRAGRLRLSPHVYNTEDEIDRTLEALASLL